MRIPDHLIIKFFQLATSLSGEEVAKLKAALEAGSNPKDAKEILAHQVVQEQLGGAIAQAAWAQWRRVHSQRQAPEAMPTHTMATPIQLRQLLVETQLAPSRTQATKQVESGAVKLDGVTLRDANVTIGVPVATGAILQFGKRRFVRLIPAVA
jgi:tyrosyl-tRNA synthetase